VAEPEAISDIPATGGANKSSGPPQNAAAATNGTKSTLLSKTYHGNNSIITCIDAVMLSWDCNASSVGDHGSMAFSPSRQRA